MIRQCNFKSELLLEKLKSNNYSRRIKSHFEAYGLSYDFSRFFVVSDESNLVGLISIFNSSLVISTYENMILSDKIIEEISHFTLMNKPALIELDCIYSDKMLAHLGFEYSSDLRTEFEFVSKSKDTEILVDTNPKLDNVYDILKGSFHALANSYELWLTDTSHRIRRELSKTFLYEGCTTATVQYIIDKTVLIGHVATTPEKRGNFYARKLLYWVGEEYAKNGYKVKLYARPNRVSYYDEIGFKEIGTDKVLERTFIDDK